LPTVSVQRSVQRPELDSVLFGINHIFTPNATGDGPVLQLDLEELAELLKVHPNLTVLAVVPEINALVWGLPFTPSSDLGLQMESIEQAERPRLIFHKHWRKEHFGR
jgi:hypothetical protein